MQGQVGGWVAPWCLSGEGLRWQLWAEQHHLPSAVQLADVVDSEALQVYMKPPAHEESKAPSKGFVVRDAPWTSSNSEKVRWHFSSACSWAKLVG